ncbi:MAG TPA: hypothetical protein VHZ29_18775, partial [Rhizomicrobium sp.]|jgi:hypothetical protein|nr:hypothetical protein [Rhizomicrobium sp.]
VVHSFGEMVQVVEFLRGRREVPRELRRLTGISPKMRPCDFSDIDLALIEPASPVEISFRGTAINRGAIQQEVLRPIESQGREAARLSHKWMRIGILGMDDAIRTKLGAELAALVPDDEDGEFRRAVLNETQAVKSDLAGGFRTMRELLGCPLGAVVFIFRYMPDGRPVSFPAGAREEVIAAAAQLDLPIFEPTSMVREYGVAAALEKDSRHYTQAFLPIIGAAIVEFAQAVHARAQTATRAAG